MTLAFILWFALLLAGSAVYAEAPIYHATDASKRSDEENCYIIRLKNDIPSNVQQRLFEELEGDASNSHSFKAVFKGFSKCSVNVNQLKEFAKDPYVLEIHEDQVATKHEVIQDLTDKHWGLDRIDQKDLPLDRLFRYDFTGSGVNIFILDTGVQGDHQDFGGRVEVGYNAVGGKNKPANKDCDGHGTHVAGIAAGTSCGVAKNAKIIPVRVLNCGGSGAYADIIDGFDWIKLQSRKPGVINMSFGGPLNSLFDVAVQALIEDGYHVVVAAGNDAGDACATSPASVTEAITVGSTTSLDTRSSFSNQGSCVDLLAPGSYIYSADAKKLNGFITMSGTSMASPAVAGVVATIAGKDPLISPVAMVIALKNGATPDKLSGLNADTPNLLLNSAGPLLAIPPGLLPPSSEPENEVIVPNRRAVSSEVAPHAATSAAGHPQRFLWLGAPIFAILVIFALLSLRRSPDVHIPAESLSERSSSI